MQHILYQKMQPYSHYNFPVNDCVISNVRLLKKQGNWWVKQILWGRFHKSFPWLVKNKQLNIKVKFPRLRNRQNSFKCPTIDSGIQNTTKWTSIKIILSIKHSKLNWSMQSYLNCHLPNRTAVGIQVTNLGHRILRFHACMAWLITILDYNQQPTPY